LDVVAAAGAEEEGKEDEAEAAAAETAAAETEAPEVGGRLRGGQGTGSGAGGGCVGIRTEVERADAAAPAWAGCGAVAEAASGEAAGVEVSVVDEEVGPSGTTDAVGAAAGDPCVLQPRLLWACAARHCLCAPRRGMDTSGEYGADPTGSHRTVNFSLCSSE
jgi:hypothetical protein